MSNPESNFSNIQALTNHLQSEVRGSILIGHQTCPDYGGMVRSLMIVFDLKMLKYELDIQWSSFGLDLYGDTLQESYLYEFDTLEELLTYLLEEYNVKINDIPIKYRFNQNLFPNPIKDKESEALFQAAWQRFQLDFKKGIFLDTRLKLNYDSNEHP